jgi:hypothetical protein
MNLSVLGKENLCFEGDLFSREVEISSLIKKLISLCLLFLINNKLNKGAD